VEFEWTSNFGNMGLPESEGGVVLFNILFGAYSKHYGKSYLGIREI